MRFAKMILIPALVTAASPVAAVEKFGPKEAAAAVAADKAVLIDIRTPAEWAETGVAEPATPIDMTSPDFMTALGAVIAANPGKKIALICRSGNRSGQLTAQMEAAGMTNVIDVTGGTTQWIADGLPVKPFAQ